jgi:hypothetical protein
MKTYIVKSKKSDNQFIIQSDDPQDALIQALEKDSASFDVREITASDEDRRDCERIFEIWVKEVRADLSTNPDHLKGYGE